MSIPIDPVQQSDPPRGWIGDLALTGFLLFATVFPYYLAVTFDVWLNADWRAVLVGLLMVTPLALRSHAPLLMLAIATVGGFAHMLLIPSPLPCLIVVPLQVYAVARWVPEKQARWAVVVGLAGSVGGPLSWAYFKPWGWTFNVIVLAMLVCLGMVLSPYVIGRRVREHWETKARLQREHAEKIQRLLEEREQRARVAEISARQQIARELHDIVAHSVSVMVVQAEGGRALATKKPERAAEALATIAETGREALTEMRRIVGVLRSGPEDDPSYAPAPGLEGIADMVARTGDRVSLTITGEPPATGQAVALTCFRVVQEALTNFLKHAGPDAHAQVRIDYSPRRVVLDITDDGVGVTAATDDGMGNGLKGMRERVTAMNGTLTAAAHPEGGFAVHAELPAAGAAEPSGRHTDTDPPDAGAA